MLEGGPPYSQRAPPTVIRDPLVVRGLFIAAERGPLEVIGVTPTARRDPLVVRGSPLSKYKGLSLIYYGLSVVAFH